MDGTKKGINISGKDNKITKKKGSKRDEVVTSAHGIRMKGITLGVIVDGQSRGVSPLDNPKEFKCNKLKKVGDHAPL